MRTAQGKLENLQYDNLHGTRMQDSHDDQINATQEAIVGGQLLNMQQTNVVLI